MITLSATRRGQLGSAALQIALVMPVVLLLITAAVQMATLQTDRNVMQSAAAHALETARVQGGTDASGAAAARQALDQFRSLHDVHVQVTRSSGIINVELTATTSSVVPGVVLPIHAVASGPEEPAA